MILSLQDLLLKEIISLALMILEDFLSLLPDEYLKRSLPKVKFFITPGGFIDFDWPNSTNINNLPQAAINASKQALNTGNLRSKLLKVANYLTLGVDTISSSSFLKSHAEFLKCRRDLTF